MPHGCRKRRWPKAFVAVRSMVIAAITLISSSVGPLGFAWADEEMTFRLAGSGGNCNGCEWIAAEGEITENTPGRLRGALDEFETRFFVFDSMGGDLVAAIELGLMLREAAAATSVGRTVPTPDSDWTSVLEPTVCASACAFAFLGGTSRLVEANEIGVHQFYEAAALESPADPIFSALDLSASQVLHALVLNYVVEMGVDPRFVSTAASVPPTSMRFLQDSELDAWRVRYDPEAFGDWAIEPWKNGIIAFSRTADELTTATVFCTADGVPRLYINSKVNWWAEGEFLDPVPHLDRIEVFNTPVARSDVSISYTPGNYELRIKLPGFDPTNLPDEGEIGIEADTARVFAVHFYFQMKAKGSAANIGAALRNCI